MRPLYPPDEIEPAPPIHFDHSEDDDWQAMFSYSDHVLAQVGPVWENSPQGELGPSDLILAHAVRKREKEDRLQAILSAPKPDPGPTYSHGRFAALAWALAEAKRIEEKLAACIPSP